MLDGLISVKLGVSYGILLLVASQAMLGMMVLAGLICSGPTWKTRVVD